MGKIKRNVLIVAYACEPNRTSEPGVGWNFSREISKFSNLTVLTRLNNKSIIESSEKNKINFIYYDLPSFFLFLKKRIPLGTQLYFFFWQWGAYFRLKKHLKTNVVDLIHHLNFSVIWNPPPFFMIKKPFIWGPVGGGDLVPYKFLKSMGFKSILNESLYFFTNLLSKCFFFFGNRNLNSLILRTNSSKKLINNKKFKDITVICETASDPMVSKDLESKLFGKEIYALCIGRMNYWKGFLYAVKGFHSFIENGGIGKLELYGNGPELAGIKKYVFENNLENEIKVMGLVDNEVIKEVLKKANVLLHPSFRDGGSWSIMEAMSYGLPVICLNTSGPKDMVSKECGFLISLDSEAQIVNDISLALGKLYDSGTLLKLKSKNSEQRILNEYTWRKRGIQIAEVYNKLM